MASKFCREQHAHRSVRWQSNIRIRMRFALFAPFKPGSVRACRTGTGRSTRRTPVSSARIVKLAQRVPAFPAWVRCWSYANTFVNTFPVFTLCAEKVAHQRHAHPLWGQMHESRQADSKDRMVLQIYTTKSFVIYYHRGRHLTALDAHH